MPVIFRCDFCAKEAPAYEIIDDREYPTPIYGPPDNWLGSINPKTDLTDNVCSELCAKQLSLKFGINKIEVKE